MNIFVSLLEVKKACVIFINVDFENLVLQKLSILLNQIMKRKSISNFRFVLDLFFARVFLRLITLILSICFNDFEKFKYLVVYDINWVEPIVFYSSQNSIVENFILKLNIVIFDQNKAHINFREKTWNSGLLLLRGILNIFARFKVEKNLYFFYLHLMVQIFEKHTNQ